MGAFKRDWDDWLSENYYELAEQWFKEVNKIDFKGDVVDIDRMFEDDKLREEFETWSIDHFSEAQVCEAEYRMDSYD